jgi:hypothetical protein
MLTGSAPQPPTTRKRRPEDGDPKKKKTRAQRQAEIDDEEEARLTRSLFGNGDGGRRGTADTHVWIPPHTQPPQSRKAVEPPLAAAAPPPPLFSFEIDRVGDASIEVDDEPHTHTTTELPLARLESSTLTEMGAATAEADDADAAAWIDEDDEVLQASLVSQSRLAKLRRERAEVGALSGTQLEQRLRQRFCTTTQATARTDWAHHPLAAARESSQNKYQNTSDDDVPSTSARLLTSDAGMSGGSLPANILSLKRCPDANLTDVAKATVQAVHFHPASDPNAPIMIAAGLDKTLRFFSVSESKSTKIHGIHCTLCILH